MHHAGELVAEVREEGVEPARRRRRAELLEEDRARVLARAGRARVLARAGRARVLASAGRKTSMSSVRLREARAAEDGAARGGAVAGLAHLVGNLVGLAARALLCHLEVAP